MVKKSYFDVVKYPLGLWVLYEIVFLIVGFTGYAAITAQMMLGLGALVLAILFGVWTGKRASKAFSNYMWVSGLSAIMLVVVVGVLGVIFTAILTSYSASFGAFVGLAAPSLTALLSASITTWIEIAMVAIVSALLTYEFSTKS